MDISQSQRNQALYAYEKTVRNAFAEVNNSLDAISRYQEQLTELLAQQDVAQETLRIAQNRYRNGYSSYLDVLDAQRTLFSVQTSVVQVKNNLLLAQIDLYKADFIICCGTEYAFMDACYKDREVDWKMTSRGIWYFRDGKSVVISFSHPEARVKDAYLFYALTDAVKEIMRCEEFEEQL